MKKIDLFEKAIAEQVKSLADYGINGTMFWAYRKSLGAENELLNFEEVIWDEDIEPIAACLDANGIREFTISSTFSGLIPTLATFDKLGFKVAGITEVNASYTDFRTGKHARVPAVRLARS